MKVYGKRILKSSLRFTFEVDGDEVSAADAMNIERVNEIVDGNMGGGTSLSDLVDRLKPLVLSEGEVRVAIEPIYDE